MTLLHPLIKLRDRFTILQMTVPVEALTRILNEQKRIYTNDILDAYDAFDGENVDTFTTAWDSYLAGEDEPCPESRDGLHVVTAGSCDNCGSKNRT